MIPNIGLMIAGYIILRCIETLCRHPSHFTSTGAQTFVQAMAILVILVTGFLTLDLMLGSSQSFDKLLTWSPSPASQTSEPAAAADAISPAHPAPCRAAHAHTGSGGFCLCDFGYHEDPRTFQCVQNAP